MLLIVTLSVSSGSSPLDALKEMDATLSAAGFKKEVSSPVKPGKEYSVTYEGPNAEKTNLEELLQPLAQKHGLTISVETEESVRFP